VGADKSLARPGRKQATATEDFDVQLGHNPIAVNKNIIIILLYPI
jgi:hypothetical protein